MLPGEGLAARCAEFGLDRVNKTDVVGFPQHAFDLGVTIARCESSRRVAKCIARIHVGSTAKLRYRRLDVASISGRDHRFMWLLRIIPAHDNPPYRRTRPRIYEPHFCNQEESEGTIADGGTTEHFCNAYERYRQDRTICTAPDRPSNPPCIATTPSSRQLESRCIIRRRPAGQGSASDCCGARAVLLDRLLRRRTCRQRRQRGQDDERARKLDRLQFDRIRWRRTDRLRLSVRGRLGRGCRRPRSLEQPEKHPFRDCQKPGYGGNAPVAIHPRQRLPGVSHGAAELA